jgi:hypothetical protein
LLEAFGGTGEFQAIKVNSRSALQRVFEWPLGCEPIEALGETNKVDGVELGNVIGIQGFWNTVWRWHTHLKVQGVSCSLQYIGLGSLLWKHLQRA